MLSPYQKLQAIQGLIHDFEERLYFQASTGCKGEWTDQETQQHQDEVIAGIKDILEK